MICRLSARDYYNDQGGGGCSVGTASYGLSGDGGVVFGWGLLVGGCVCLLLFFLVVVVC